MKTTEEQIMLIKSEYLSGKSPSQISELLNIGAPRIDYYVKKLGIRRSHSQSSRKYYLDESIFREIDCSWKAYFIGWMYSDGNVYVGSQRNSASLCISERDKDVLDYFNMKIYNNSKPLNFRESRLRNNTNYLCKALYRLIIDSKAVCDDLIRHGVVPAKSKTINKPGFIDEKFLPRFIQGVFEGDGNISNNRTIDNRVVKIFSASKDFIEWLKYVLDDKYEIQMNLIESNGLFTLYISNKDAVLKFKKLIYLNSEFKMNRKYNRFIY